MFQGSTFRPSAAEGFMPQVELSGTDMIRSRQAQAFYQTVSLERAGLLEMGQSSQPSAPTPQAKPETDLTLPVLLGAGAIALALLLS